MVKKVLMIDDDQVLLELINKKISKSEKAFSITTTNSGEKALSLLKQDEFSIVVTDLQMPEVDGYELLAEICEHYPDIPVIVVTAFGKSKTKQVVIDSGAASYIEKPLIVEELSETIKSILKKQSEGGNLRNSSLEMFIQLIEMEMKTCTIRVTEKKKNQKGVLFFKEGVLIDARSGQIQGVDAAHKILIWNNVNIKIENRCVDIKKKITEDTQAILLEAMRMKDENEDENENEDEDEDEKKSQNKKKTGEKLFTIDVIKETLKNALPDHTDAIKNIIFDNSLVNQTDNLKQLGEIFNAGKLEAIYIDNKEELTNSLIIPDDNISVISFSQKFCRNKIMNALITVP